MFLDLFAETPGLEKIALQEQKLIDILIEGLPKISGVTLFTAADAAKQAPVISLNIAGYKPDEVGAILDHAFDIKVRAGLHCSPEAHKTLGTFPQGTLRLSPGYFNTEAEMEQTIQAINAIAKAKKSGWR